MADAYLNMLDLSKKTGADAVTGLIETNLSRYPEARLFPARTIAGTSYKTLLRSEYPTPAFRSVNEGVELQKATYDSKLVSCAFLDGQLEIDEAVVTADDGGVASVMELEASGMIRGILRTLGKQVWYGTSNDAKGFPGAQSVVDSSLVVDATGTTASTGSSVYLVAFGPQSVSMVFGEGRLLSMPEWTRQRVTRNSKSLFAWVSNISGWAGVQWANPYALGRIKNLTEDANKGLTDSLIQDLLARFPEDADLSNARLFMTRRSARQLQKSRSATSVSNLGPRTAGGIEVAAPWPTESCGIPIELTSSIVNTETIA
jgi:hypothetical protein